MRIHAALMTQNELHDLVPNLAALEPHVHTITVVDGGSLDGTIPYLRNWSRQPSGAKIRLFIHPWQDDFPGQRNNYMRRVGEIAEPGDWVLAFDPDEYLDHDALHALPDTIALAQAHRIERVAFRCRSVSYRGPDRVWESLDAYWKPLLFAWHDGLRYDHDGETPVHEVQRGVRTATIHLGQTPGVPQYCYEHRKQENVIWPRGVRNYFCGGGGPNRGRSNAAWVELREWAAVHLGIPFDVGRAGWHRMHAYLIAGNIDPWLKEWILRQRLESGWDGASEAREFFKAYFRLYHPEEEPEETRGEQVP